ncbi:MAG: HAMP domain-containing protein [Rubrobacteraceae bacterium]|nr:HAMP domain-containing protein [Rubrobacteraceae bacterium]
MNLRRKLFVTFGTLALLGLVVAGVSIWATLRWETSNEDLQGHYLRSLQAQRIRAITFEAFKEVSDALGENDSDARQEFEQALEPADRDFEMWANLAETDEEKRQVREVREDYDTLVADARKFFDLLDSGRRNEAADLADGKIEEADFENFVASTGQAVASDRERRDEVRARAEDARRTAQLVLIVAAFGTISLMLLLAAYLTSDLFRPLRELEQALEDVGKGDLNRHLDAERADEIGAVSAAFNRMVETIGRREQMGSSSADQDGAEGNGLAWRDAPSRVTLHRLVSQLRTRITRLGNAETADGATEEERRELVSQLEGLSQAVARVTEFGFPLDLDLSRTDIRELVYRVFMRYGDEFADRSVSLDLEISPEVDYAVVDRLKLREALAELLRNALDALPERGGHLGLRSRLSEDGAELLIEVDDDGAGAEQSLIDAAFDLAGDGEEGQPHTGLTLTKAIVEQHGGSFGIESEPGEGTYARMQLPLRR